MSLGLTLTKSGIQEKLEIALSCLATAAGLIIMLTLASLIAAVAYAWALHHDWRVKKVRVGALPVLDTPSIKLDPALHL